jgi:hypothetical protein
MARAQLWRIADVLEQNCRKMKDHDFPAGNVTAAALDVR